MTGIVENLLPSISVVGWLPGVLSYIIKTTLLSLLALLLYTMMRAQSPANRHQILKSSLLGILALTILAPLVPSWLSLPGFLETALMKVTPVVPQYTKALVVSESVDHQSYWILLPFILWFIGSLVVGFRLVIAIIAVRNIVKNSSKITDPGLSKAASRIANNLNIRLPVSYYVSDKISIPMVWGLLHPTVIFPKNFTEWAAGHRDMVLLHELAHIKRNDIFWRNLASLVTVIHWFNPLIWVVKRRMLLESEYACDDFVLTAGVRAGEYARHLLWSARDACNMSRLMTASTALAHYSNLEGRIMSIFNKRKRTMSASKLMSTIVISLTLSLVIIMAGLSCQSSDEASAVESNSSDKATGSLVKPEEIVEVDVFPEMIYEEKVIYPKAAKEAGIEGVVWIKAYVDETGMVRNAKVAKSSGEQELDDSALKAAWMNKYKPALKDDKPIAVWVTYSVDFVLEEK